MNGFRPLEAVTCVLSIPLLTAAMALAMALAPGPVSAAALEHDALQAAAIGGSITLDQVAGEYRVTLPAGEVVRTPEFPRAVPTAVASLADGWMLAGSRTVEGGGQRLFLRRGGTPVDGAAEARSMPVPGRRWGHVRRDPVLFVEGEELVGMAWLEGPGGESLAVVASAWRDGQWGRPEMVSPLRRGSQLALAAAVLEDGSWLLVWTADDATDAETVWSRRVAGAWRAPERLAADNEVPDITPALTALPGGGALAAWGQYDGRAYRLRTARFETAEGGRWVDERWAGVTGSMYPSFAGDRQRPVLLYRDGAVSGWAAAALDGSGRALHLERVVDAPSARPALDRSPTGASVLRWPASGRSALARRVVEETPPAEGSAP